MNRYITILIYKGLRVHQILIKNNLPMKRENRANNLCTTTQMMIFSFGKCFDEIMMRIYYIVTQWFDIAIHQFIGFLIIIKP